ACVLALLLGIGAAVATAKHGDRQPNRGKASTDAGTGKAVLTVVVNGVGRVSGPNGISCPGVCTASFSRGKRITLQAVSGELRSWQGGGSTRGGCRLTMDRNRQVTATFSTPPPSSTSPPPSSSPPPPPPPPPPSPTYTLDVTASGTGTVGGTGISCPGD